MSLFRLDTSIRHEGSVSRALGDIVEESWRIAGPGEVVVRRSIGTDPVPATTWANVITANYRTEEERSPEQRESLLLRDSLADELANADSFLLTTSLYNFGVSEHLKTWIDVVATDPRVGGSDKRSFKGRNAVLVIVRGGAYGEGTPREGWDHATGWIRRMLEDVWGFNLRVVETEFTLVGVNPALDEFKELAAAMRRDAEGLARQHGKHLTVDLRKSA